MRGLKSTIALFVVLVGLSAYIYFVTSKQPPKGSETAKERVFAGLTPDKIDEIQVKSESGETTTLKKVDGAWKMTSPLAVNGDEGDASAIATNLSSLEVTRVVDANPSAADLKEYGLDMPRVEVAFKASSDKAYADLHRVLVGGKSPTGGDLFIKRDADKRVVLVAGYVDAIFNRTTFDLREKLLIKFDREKADRITQVADGKTLEFAKSGSDWSVTKPVALGADFSAVDSLVGRLLTAAMKTLVTEQATPADLKKYGFDKPQGSLTVHAGDATVSLIIGGKVNDFDVYVRDPATTSIATVDAAFLKELQKTEDEYRRKELFTFRGFVGDRLEFTRNGQATVFEKVKSQDQTPDKWRRVSPNPGEPKVVDMESLIAKLENLRATSFIASTDKTGLDKPELTILAKFDEGKKEERVSFVKSGADVLTAKVGEPGGAKIAMSEFDATIKALDEVSK